MGSMFHHETQDMRKRMVLEDEKYDAKNAQSDPPASRHEKYRFTSRDALR